MRVRQFCLPILAIPLLGSATLGAPQVRANTANLTLKKPDENGIWTEKGTVVLTQRLLTEGGKSVDIRIDMGEISTRQQSIYDMTGAPIRRYTQTFIAERLKVTKIVTFGKTGAQVVTDREGTRSTEAVPFLKNIPTKNASEFWFLRGSPKPGQTVQWQNLNDANEFVTLKATYKGKVPLPNKNVYAELVVTEYPDRKVETFMDQAGNLLLLRDSSGKQMERR